MHAAMVMDRCMLNWLVAIRAGTGCQDSAACIELVLGRESVLLAIVSDGSWVGPNSLQSVRVLRSNASRAAQFHISEQDTRFRA